MKKTSEMRKMARRGRVWPGLVVSASLFFCAEAQAGISSAGPEAPLGQWDLSLASAAPAPSSELIKLAAKANAPRSTGASSEAAGRYSVLREGAKDTGCMLTLDAKAAARGGNKASLAPGCRDQGIVIFDPVGWQIVGGRLVLTARKGHSTHLDQQSDGTWLKDPKEGKSLSLKKM